MEAEDSNSEDAVVEKSSTGLEPRLAAVLSYLGFFVSGIFFLVIERDSSYVRFHAMQSTVTFISLFVIWVVAKILPGYIGWLVSAGSLVLWALLMVKAWQGERYMLPMIGEMAEGRTRSR